MGSLEKYLKRNTTNKIENENLTDSEPLPVRRLSDCSWSYPHCCALCGQYQVVLKEIDLPVGSNYECQDKLRSTRLGQKYKLHDSFICAGGVNGKDTCKGDGGSPLVCPSKYDPN